MEIRRVLLKDIIVDYPEENIYNWDYITVDSNTRIYLKLIDKDKQGGFFFYVVSIISSIYNKEWDINETEVECLYRGIAYFDGIRHLYMGSEQTDNEGYTYYPHLDTHIKTLLILKDLQSKYCIDD